MDDLAQQLSQAEATAADIREHLSAASQQLMAAQAEAASAAARLQAAEVRSIQSLQGEGQRSAYDEVVVDLCI